MKRNGDRPATRNDLQAHAEATKKDLSAVEAGLKKDLSAVEAGLKKDLSAVEAGLRKDLSAVDAGIRKDLSAVEAGISGRMDTLETVMRRMAVAQARGNAELGGKIDDLRESVREIFSRTLGHVDGFMSKVKKVDRGQILLVHRVDKLEDRVTAVERRSS